jgi:hypothetical protein
MYPRELVRNVLVLSGMMPEVCMILNSNPYILVRGGIIFEE